jgi:hypothetical protein
MEGPAGGFVNVRVGVCGMMVFVGMFVAVGTFGVADALVTPITTGVAVNMEGVDVKGRNGVGGLPGNG